MAKSFSPLKWVGSKSRLVPELLSFLPEIPVGYYEPFAGGASLYFAYGQRATGIRCLNDICSPLMNAYTQIRDNLDKVLSAIANAYQTPYEVIRFQFNELKKIEIKHTEEDRILYAALFIAINFLGFNGLYRENKKGELNVPEGKDSKGRKRSLGTIEVSKWIDACEALRDTELLNKPFSPWPFSSTPGLGDVVLFDSPYLKEFSGYNKEGFTSDHHLLLCAQATAIARKGATVIVCGSNNDASREIYGEPTRVVSLQRTVGNFKNSNKKRGKAEEALWVWNSKGK